MFALTATAPNTSVTKMRTVGVKKSLRSRHRPARPRWLVVNSALAVLSESCCSSGVMEAEVGIDRHGAEAVKTLKNAQLIGSAWFEFGEMRGFHNNTGVEKGGREKRKIF